MKKKSKVQCIRFDRAKSVVDAMDLLQGSDPIVAGARDSLCEPSQSTSLTVVVPLYLKFEVRRLTFPGGVAFDAWRCLNDEKYYF